MNGGQMAAQSVRPVIVAEHLRDPVLEPIPGFWFRNVEPAWNLRLGIALIE
jgi:hypothetical protein